MDRLAFVFTSIAMLLGSSVSVNAAGLSFVEVHVDSVGDRLSMPGSLAVSPDESHVYVPSKDEDAITVFSRDAEDGSLTLVQAVEDANLSAPQAVVVTPDGTQVYAASAQGLVVFNRNGGDGTLTFVETVEGGVCAAGQVGEACSSDGDCDTGAEEPDGKCIQGVAEARSIAISPGGSHVYVASPGDNAVAVFSRDGGNLTFVQAVVNGVCSAGTPGESCITNSDCNTEGANDGRCVDGLLGARRVVLSADGQHVYVASAEDGAVAVFGRDEDSGALGVIEVNQGINGLTNVQSVAVSPDGESVYAVSNVEDAVVIFDRSATTGSLIPRATVDGIDGLNGARAVIVSPDGSHVYVASAQDDAVVVFKRTITGPNTGLLTHVETRNDGTCVAGNVGEDCTLDSDCNTSGKTDGVCVGLGGASALTTSPGGNHLYVSGTDDDALVVYRVHLCGDGFLDGPDEECDDSNAEDGDCCSSTCQIDSANTPCDDGVFCNGDDFCGPNGNCGLHTTNPCDAENECANVCDEENDTCNVPAGTECSDDADVCTDDVCDGEGTCTHPFNMAPCEDDGDPCTNDLCDGVGNCGHTPNSGNECDDGLFCTELDVCENGACVGSGDPCDGGPECASVCNEDDSTCFLPEGTACTDDGETCTDDTCDGFGTCSHPANNAACDDGLFCNGADQCKDGTCSLHGDDPCAGAPECQRCNEATDSCLQSAGTPCSTDANPCTDDVCMAGGCEHVTILGCEVCFSDGDCDDGNPCTTDGCGNQGCTHTAVPGCGFCEVDGDCDDGNLCTTDACSDGVCSHVAILGCLFCAGDEDCDDGDSCTLDTCGADDQCDHSAVDPQTACFSGASCSFVDGLSVDAACAGERIPKAIGKLVDRAGCKIEQAEVRARAGRSRVQKKLKLGLRNLNRAAKKIRKARGKKISGACAEALTADLTDRLNRVDALMEQSLLGSCTQAVQTGASASPLGGPSLCK